MGYQVPKANHPWRQYPNRDLNTKKGRPKKRNIKSVQVFICEIAESWGTIEVVTTAYGKEGRFTLKELPQTKQAAWLAGLLKKNYG